MFFIVTDLWLVDSILSGEIQNANDPRYKPEWVGDQWNVFIPPEALLLSTPTRFYSHFRSLSPGVEAGEDYGLDWSVNQERQGGKREASAGTIAEKVEIAGVEDVEERLFIKKGRAMALAM